MRRSHPRSLLHLPQAAVPAAYEVEASLYETLVQGGDFGYSVTSTSEWLTWLADTFLTSTLFTGANPNDDVVGYVSNYNLMIGGIRLVTTRGNPTSCDRLNCAFRCVAVSTSLGGRTRRAPAPDHLPLRRRLPRPPARPLAHRSRPGDPLWPAVLHQGQQQVRLLDRDVRQRNGAHARPVEPRFERLLAKRD